MRNGLVFQPWGYAFPKDFPITYTGDDLTFAAAWKTRPDDQLPATRVDEVKKTYSREKVRTFLKVNGQEELFDLVKEMLQDI